MLRKVGNIVLILVMLIATSGVAVTRHYCGPTEMSFSIYSTPKSCCDSHCDKCHNVFKFSKVNDNFEAGSSISIQALTDFVSLHTSFFIDLFDNVTISPLAILINQRAVDNLAAGHSPASLGNFRC
ncbi:MAG: hypothetical protein WC780_00510 [Lentimicrobiaceae bacterium]|jgi:hypothetical protein